ncbi:MAG: tetratricopeptide repeat protein [Deltaproteobacteria bacterium]
MRTFRFLWVIALLFWTGSTVDLLSDPAAGADSSKTPRELLAAGAYTGTSSCRECHEKFYRLWAPSHHGLAMQKYTDAFAKTALTPQQDDIVIRDRRYKAATGAGEGWIIEKGSTGTKKYPIEYALGGKNVYYFLTPMSRGRLQVVPLAYDVRKKQWYNTTGSMIRHFIERRDEPLEWTDSALTFNTSCYGCHVSQLSTNYDVKTETYHTTWREPGINCETCHGPGEQHVRVCKAAPKGTVPKDLKIIRGGRDFTHEQNNANCSSCHAKAVPIEETFTPGDRFFDHFDLVTLEHPDFYPDGRDLGENYTYTSWRMSPCVKSGKLDCLHCHTSSGRYRFAGEKTNNACMPCHAEKVNNPTAHTHHKADSPGNRCVACHMPMTEFARMRRSDHSMIPPAPAVTIAFKSPNACNLCHKDKSAQWADTWVRKWRAEDYQAPLLYRASLIDAARKQDWTKLQEMLAYLGSDHADEIFATSLIRLLRRCPDERKWPVILKKLEDPSPLVRAAAVSTLQDNLTPEILRGLLNATDDDYRLVRTRAAAALSRYPRRLLSEKDRRRLKRASEEYEASLQSRPDNWESYYNLGNYFLNRGEVRMAALSFERASQMRPQSILPLVNASIAYARLGKPSKAGQALRQALEIDPDNAEANFNMGLFKAEQNDLAQAESYLRKALKSDPSMAPAAYNLGVLLAKDRLAEGIKWCKTAYRLKPSNPKYAFTLAFFLTRKGDLDSAIDILSDALKRQTANGGIYMLLAEIYRKQGAIDRAAEVYRKALENRRISPGEKRVFSAKLKDLESKR